jgi:hypothetical protein
MPAPQRHATTRARRRGAAGPLMPAPQRHATTRARRRETQSKPEVR